MCNSTLGTKTVACSEDPTVVDHLAVALALAFGPDIKPKEEPMDDDEENEEKGEDTPEEGESTRAGGPKGRKLTRRVHWKHFNLVHQKTR